MARPYTKLDEDECHRLGGKYENRKCLVRINGEQVNVHDADVSDPLNSLQHFHVNLSGPREAVMSEAARDFASNVARNHGYTEADDKNLPVKLERSEFSYSRSFNYY